MLDGNFRLAGLGGKSDGSGCRKAPRCGSPLGQAPLPRVHRRPRGHRLCDRVEHQPEVPSGSQRSRRETEGDAHRLTRLQLKRKRPKRRPYKSQRLCSPRQSRGTELCRDAVLIWSDPNAVFTPDSGAVKGLPVKHRDGLAFLNQKLCCFELANQVR